MVTPELRAHSSERRSEGLTDLQALTELAQELGSLLLWREVRTIAAL
jgi:hypothetical protein